MKEWVRQMVMDKDSERVGEIDGDGQGEGKIG